MRALGYPNCPFRISRVRAPPGKPSDPERIASIQAAHTPAGLSISPCTSLQVRCNEPGYSPAQLTSLRSGCASRLHAYPATAPQPLSLLPSPSLASATRIQLKPGVP